MNMLSPEKVWSLDERELLGLLDSKTHFSINKKVRFFTPSFAFNKAPLNCSLPEGFPTISVTGKRCWLNCRHCERKILRTMYPAETPRKLFRIAEKLKHRGSVGCLVSGGCLPDGSVPLRQFIPVLEKIKQDLALTVVVHTGIISAATAAALKQAGIDTALIDVIGSDLTIKEICNLHATTVDYEDSLRALKSSNLRFVPHVIVGLQNGELEGEWRALKIIRQHEPSALVIIAFMPIHGTEMESVKPPRPATIARVIATARSMFPETMLALGCMRPKGRHRAETDVMALKAGVDAIAFPSEEVVKYTQEERFEISFSPYCCSQIYMENITRSVSK